MSARQRQRVWRRLCIRAARRDQAVAESQQSDVTMEEHARRVWLAQEALDLVLRMSKGEF